MKKSKLDALLWEQNLFESFIYPGATNISQENLDSVCFENINELSVSRDEDYNIKLTCISHMDCSGNSASAKKFQKQEDLAGTLVPEGKIILKLFDDFQVIMKPCYYNGCESKKNKIEYKISCYHIEGKSLSKKKVALKEWLLNGNSKGLCFCANEKFEYTVEGTTFGVYCNPAN